MAAPRVKVSSCFFVCAISFLVVAKSCFAGCGIDGGGQCSARTKREINDENRPKIPLFLAQQLNEADSIDEMLELINPSIVEPPVVAQQVLSRSASPLSRVRNAVSSLFGTRFGGRDESRVVVEARGAKPKSTKIAKCQEPILVPVPVPQPKEANTWYIPECVYLEQCSGCCNSDLYQCEPTSTEKVPVQVAVYHPEGYVRRGDERQRNTVPVIMEKHLKCACACKVKPEHCNEFQRHEYCECVCTNNDERNKCLSNRKKVWDRNRCACGCKEIEECTTGLEFNLSTCSCEIRPQSSVSTRIGSLGGDGRYETRTEEKRIRRWGNNTSPARGYNKAAPSS